VTVSFTRRTLFHEVSQSVSQSVSQPVSQSVSQSSGWSSYRSVKDVSFFGICERVKVTISLYILIIKILEKRWEGKRFWTEWKLPPHSEQHACLEWWYPPISLHDVITQMTTQIIAMKISSLASPTAHSIVSHSSVHSLHSWFSNVK